MTETQQTLELPLFGEATEEETSAMVMLLSSHGHLTRRHLMDLTGWNDRHIREIAEALGATVIRGAKGFCLFDQAPLDEVEATIRRFELQSQKMAAVAVELRRRLHRRVG
jgi:hypothetical protein